MRKLRVLVAEDDLFQRDLFTVMLEMEGYQVRAVADGREALAELRRNPPDVLVTDIMMPDMDGLELIKRVRAKKEFAELPIVVMTAYGKGYLTGAWEAGANEMLAKPFAPEELSTAILNVLPESQGH